MIEQIRSNRRKIVLGTTAYMILVAATTLFFIVLMFRRFDSNWVWVFLGIYLALNLCIFYFTTRSGTRLLLWLLGATPVYQGGFQPVQDAVKNIALASGLPEPELMFIDSATCNAMSLKKGDRRMIFFTHGLAEELNEDELTAVMGHEMAHLYNGDAALNELILSLNGISLLFAVLFERFTNSVKSGPIEGGVFDTIRTWVFCTLVVIAIFLLYMPAYYLFEMPAFAEIPEQPLIVMVAFSFAAVNLLWAALLGMIMRTLIDPCREMLADELSVQWTMYPEGLAGAINDASAHATMYKYKKLRSLFFVPSHFADRQPSPRERIAHLEEILHLKIGEESA
jgi:Zn-dependent protease with chaperone function